MTTHRGMNAGRSRRGRTSALVAALLAPWWGCGDAGPKRSDAEPEAKPIVKTADRGAVRLSVTAAKDRISIAERVGLTIEVEAEPGINVDLPEFGAAMNEFQIRDFRELPVEELESGRRRFTQIYDLDIFLSGEYTIPAITATYRDRRQLPAGQQSGDEEALPPAELTTEPITVQVASLLEGDFDPTKFRDVKSVVELPADRTRVWIKWLSGAGIVATVVAGVVVIVRRRRRRPRRVAVIAPHEWAFGQLRELAAAGLCEQGLVREFYYRLSEIARVYIELRFGLMAPERTTEEFLEEMAASEALQVEHQSSVRAFLEACDMVKYACHNPGTDEIERVFHAARDFIDATRQTQRVREEVAA